MMKKGKEILGAMLILVGALLLFNNVFHFAFLNGRHFWPLLVLAIGLIFEWGYFSGENNPGLLVPGGILTVIGLLFFFESITGWTYSGYTWPVYLLAVALGLFQLYWFSGRNQALLIPVAILTSVAAVSFGAMIFGNLFAWLKWSYIFPLLLILFGLGVFFKGRA